MMTIITNKTLDLIILKLKIRYNFKNTANHIYAIERELEYMEKR